MFNIVTKKAIKELEYPTKNKLVDKIVDGMIKRYDEKDSFNIKFKDIKWEVEERVKDYLAEKIADAVFERKKDELISTIYDDSTLNDLIRDNLRRKLDNKVDIF